MTRKTLTQQNQELIDKIDSLESQLQTCRETSAKRLQEIFSRDQQLTDKDKIIAAAKAELGEAHATEAKLQNRLRGALGEVRRIATERDRFAVEIAREVTTKKD